MSERLPPKPWVSSAELAEACGCTAVKVEALARRHHRPRVHGERGQKIGAEPDAVRRALGGTPATIHGSVPDA